MILPDSTLAITHAYVRQAVKNGDTVIDATMGNGHDTVFLAKLVGETGRVYAFDIQKEAVGNTAALLEKEGLSRQVTLICDGHEALEQYVCTPIKAVMFNLGYLPGGNHKIATRFETTAAALEASMRLLEPDGLISLGIYYGGDSGFEEKERLAQYLKEIDFQRFTVLVHDYVNRPNCPPIAAIIGRK